MTLTKDGRHAYVPMRGENRIDVVSAIDVATRKVIANVQFENGSGPKRILVARTKATT